MEENYRVRSRLFPDNKARMPCIPCMDHLLEGSQPWDSNYSPSEYIDADLKMDIEFYQQVIKEHKLFMENFRAEADTYKLSLITAIYSALQQLPQAIQDMKSEEYITRCNEEPDFVKQYNPYFTYVENSTIRSLDSIRNLLLSYQKIGNKVLGSVSQPRIPKIGVTEGLQTEIAPSFDEGIQCEMSEEDRARMAIRSQMSFADVQEREEDMAVVEALTKQKKEKAKGKASAKPGDDEDSDQEDEVKEKKAGRGKGKNRKLKTIKKGQTQSVESSRQKRGKKNETVTDTKKSLSVKSDSDSDEEEKEEEDDKTKNNNSSRGRGKGRGKGKTQSTKTKSGARSKTQISKQSNKTEEEEEEVDTKPVKGKTLNAKAAKNKKGSSKKADASVEREETIQLANQNKGKKGKTQQKTTVQVKPEDEEEIPDVSHLIPKKNKSRRRRN